jgi:hypothetical protein
MEGAEEGAHMGHPDFRLEGRIFASLHPGDGRGMVKLTPGQQRAHVGRHPGAFAPENGAWGRQGCTRVHLEAVDEPTLAAAIALAWENLVLAREAKPAARRRRARI